MPRPIRRRNVCSLPEFNQFGPLGACRWNKNEKIGMTVEEYETIRLIDLESLTQEECSEHMNVARTTVQAIYAEARTKIAQALIHGKSLVIEGGNYQVCDGTHLFCHRGHCQNRRNGRPMCVEPEGEEKK